MNNLLNIFRIGNAVAVSVHLFCCGVPLLLSVTSIAAVLGVGTVVNFEWFEPYETLLLIVTTVILAGAGILEWFAWRVDCRASKATHCAHGPCKPKKRWALKVYAVACLLFAMNLILFLLEL